jgi:hypothetical protein
MPQDQGLGASKGLNSLDFRDKANERVARTARHFRDNRPHCDNPVARVCRGIC